MMTYKVVAEGDWNNGRMDWSEVLASNVSSVGKAHELAHVWAERCLVDEKYEWVEYVTVVVEAGLLPSIKVHKSGWGDELEENQAGFCNIHSDFMLEGGELNG